MTLKRIIWHWTGGGHKANATDLRHYHFVIEGDGTVVPGTHAPEANAVLRDPKDSSTYAAHTRALNTGSIGIALAGMRGAKEHPLDPGPAPITEAQVRALVELTADLCVKYSIPVTSETVLSHAEVEGTLGVKQPGKWDITWLPHRTQMRDAHSIGAYLRSRVIQTIADWNAPPATKQHWLVQLLSRILKLLSKGAEK